MEKVAQNYIVCLEGKPLAAFAYLCDAQVFAIVAGPKDEVTIRAATDHYQNYMSENTNPKAFGTAMDRVTSYLWERKNRATI